MSPGVHFRQSDGPESLEHHAGPATQARAIQGQLYVRPSTFEVLKASLEVRRRDKTVMDRAEVIYVSGMPAAAVHREFRDGQLVEETIFRSRCGREVLVFAWICVRTVIFESPLLRVVYARPRRELVVPELDEGRFEQLTISGQLRSWSGLRVRTRPLDRIQPGGWVAALYAARHPEMSTAWFCSLPRSASRSSPGLIGREKMLRWEREGAIEIMHYSSVQSPPALRTRSGCRRV